MNVRTFSTLMIIFCLCVLPSTVQAEPFSTEVGGPIISDTTWTMNNNPYVVTSTVQVLTGVTLTIDPGVIVKFDDAKLLQVDGTLIARGTTDNLVVFTSNQPNPQAGDWENVKFTTTAVTTTMDAEGNYISGSILQYALVEYGNGGESGVIDTHSLLVDHCVVRDNIGSGIYDVGIAQAHARITNNVIGGNLAENGGGIYTAYATVSGNTILGNSAIGDGGGIYASRSKISGNIVSHNYANSDGGGIYSSRSTVSENTLSDNEARYYGGGIDVYDYSSVSKNTVNQNSAGSGGGGIFSSQSAVNQNTVSGNSAAWGGGIYADLSTVSKNTVNGNSASSNNEGGGGIRSLNGTVKQNIVSGNQASNDGGGIHSFGDDVIGNNVSGNSAGYSGGGIYDGMSTVMSNTVTINTARFGAGVYFDSSYPYEFSYNTIVSNTTRSPTAISGGLNIDGGYRTQTVDHNNIYGNSNYDVVVFSTLAVLGGNNYFGTTTPGNIDQHIYDKIDNPARGEFKYQPILQNPDPGAPVPPPTNLRATFSSGSITLAWDPIPSLAGYDYKVYYDTDASGPPYSGTVAIQGISPIDVGAVASFTLTGLSSDITYIAVTTSDNLDRESWYSNEVSTPNAEFTAWPTEGVKPLTVVFTNTSSTGYTTSLWDFGDTITSTEQNPTHIYTVEDVYTVTLTVSGSGGTDTLTRPDYIAVYAEEQNIVYLPLILADRSGTLLSETTEGEYTDTITVRRTSSTGTAYPVGALAVAAHLFSIDGLDPGFGVGGGVIINLGQDDDAYAVAQQADGKILVAGMTRHEHIPGYEFPSAAVVVRLMPDGSLDTTFGVGGVAIVENSSYLFYDLAIQSDGKIIAVGNADGGTHDRTLVARFNANGTLDTMFASNGVLVINLGDYGYLGNHAEAVALQTDGKIVLGGVAGKSFAAARLLSNGVLDVTFDTDGIKTISLGGYNGAMDVAIQPDGKIVLAGTANWATFGDEDIGLVRLLADGSLDPTFDGDGKAILDLGTQVWGYSVALEAGGNIVVAATMSTPEGSEAIVVRTTDSGGLDSTFDGDGVVSIDFGADFAGFADIAIQPDGKIVVVGHCDDSGSEDFIVGRLLPDGSLDPTFEGGGVIINLGGSDLARAVAVQADGKILVAGNTDSDWAILRFTAIDTNTPPVLDAIGDQTVAEADTVNMEISATDADGDSLTFTLSGQPSFTTLTDHGDGTATLILTPGFDDAGSYPGVTVTVSDSVDSDSETFTITVTVEETIHLFLPLVLRSH